MNLLKLFSSSMIALTFASGAALTLTSCSSTPAIKEDACLKRRGAIDIGSGSTKAFAAVIDVCQTPKRIVEKLYDEKVKISFGEAVEKSADGTFPADVVTDAAAKVATFAEAMNSRHVERITIVATAAFRKSKNGAETANAISDAVTARLKANNTNVDLKATRVQILSQAQEAEVGAHSALTNLPVSSSDMMKEPIIVWDIGGGSMQMWSDVPTTAGGAPPTPNLFTGDLASVTFKNAVIRDVLKKDPTNVKSPNPLKKAGAMKAVTLARAHAKKNVPEFFKTNAAKSRWVGIGGVLAISVQKQVDREANQARTAALFTDKALLKTLESRSARKDEEIESEYRETEITNLALVLGYMQELKIDRVETVEASLVQGLIAR